MRFNEIKIKPTGIVTNSPEQELDEVAMGMSALRQFANSPSAHGMQAGFEAELIFSGLSSGGRYDGDDYEPNMDMDERAYDMEGIMDFFTGGESSEISRNPSSASYRRAFNQLQESYSDFASAELRSEFDNNAESLIKDWVIENEDFDRDAEDYDQQIDARVAEAIESGTGDDAYESAFEEFSEGIEITENEWLRDAGIRYMSDVSDQFNDFAWPYYDNMSNGGEQGEFNEESAQRLADDLADKLGVETTMSGGYHSATRDTSTWIFEPDSSLEGDDSDDMPVEIVSPPMPLAQALEIMPKFFAWASKNGAYANKSTGFHMSVSMPGHQGQKLDFTKLALFLGDQYVIDQFGRAGNHYAVSAIEKIKGNKTPLRAEEVMNKMRDHLDQFATSALARSSGFGKYVTINPKDNYVEFRTAGGSNYFDDMDKIQNTMARYAQALSIAMDPESHKQEFAKKLYKLLTNVKTQQVIDPTTGRKRTEVDIPVDNNAISMFSKYVAGQLPKAALKSFIRQLQQGRETKRQADLTAPAAPVPAASAPRLQPASSGAPPADDPNGNYVLRRREGDRGDVGDRGVGPILYRFNAASGREAVEAARQWAQNRGVDRMSVYLDSIANVPDEILNAAPDAPAGNILPGSSRALALLHAYPNVLRTQLSSATGKWVIYSNTSYDNLEIVPAINAYDALEQFHMWMSAGDRRDSYGMRPADEDDIRRAQLGDELELDIAQNFQQPARSGSLSQTDIENRLGWGSQVSDATYEIVDLRNHSTPVFKLIANTLHDAARKLEQWLSVTEEDPAGFAVRRIQRSPQPAAAPAGEFSGEWKVVDGLGREIHRFSGIGNNQGDANRIAAQWARQSGVDGTIEVYPVMR